MIDIKIDDLNKELERFNNSIENFAPYTQDFINKTNNKLDDFNSDFISGFKGFLDSIRDTNAPKLLEKAKQLHTAAKEAIESFVKVDKEIEIKVKTGK